MTSYAKSRMNFSSGNRSRKAEEASGLPSINPQALKNSTVASNKGWTEKVFGRLLPAFKGDRKVLVFGDSNSARNFPGKEASWPVLLENMGKGSLQVINESIDGRTTGFDSGQLNGKEYFRQTLDRYPGIDALVIMLGTNDFKSGYGSASPEQVASNIMEMIEFSQMSDKFVEKILLTPPPIVSGENMVEGVTGKIAELADLLHQVGRKNKALVLDLQSKIKPGKHLAGDGVHLNGRGRKMVASLVYRCLRTAVTN